MQRRAWRFVFVQFSIAAAWIAVVSISSAEKPTDKPLPATATKSETDAVKPEAAAVFDWPAGRVIFRQTETERRIRAALDRPVTFQFADAPLTEVVKQLESKIGCPVALESAALEADGKGPDTRVTDSAENETLQVALRRLLRSADLAHVVEYDRLLITTRIAAESRTPVRVYQVHDLVVAPNDPTAAFPDFESLIWQIQIRCGVGTWADENGGGRGVIRQFEGPGTIALVVAHTEGIHEQIERFLAQLRASRCEELLRMQMLKPRLPPMRFTQATNLPQPAPHPLPPPPPLPRGRVIYPQSDVEHRIRETFDKPASFDLPQATLATLAEYLEREYRIPVRLDVPALTADGKGATTKIPATVRDCSLYSALRQVLEPLGLTFVVIDDRLSITTKSQAEMITPTYVYQIHDLIAHDATLVERASNESVELFDLITHVVAPDTWREGGTPGAIRGFEGPGIQVLTIEQTEAVHRQIAELLDMLREARVPQVYEAQRRRPVVIEPPNPAGTKP